MELRRIQYFVTLAEYLHFSHAADDLYISQSSLSYHIAELELELGVCLFYRNKRQVSLTKAGQQLLPVAKDILNQVQVLKSMAEMQSISDHQNMRLNICLDTSSQRYDLIGIDSAIADMHAVFPDADIHWRAFSFENVISQIKKHLCDVGFVSIRYGETLSSTLNVVSVYEDLLSLISIFEMNLSNLPTLFEQNPLFLLKDDHRWANQITALLGDMNITPHIKWEKDFASMLARVTTGDGLTVLPKSEFYAESKSRHKLKSMDFSGNKSKIIYSAVWAEDNYNPGILPLINSIRHANLSPKDTDISLTDSIISGNKKAIKSNTESQ